MNPYPISRKGHHSQAPAKVSHLTLQVPGSHSDVSCKQKLACANDM